MARPQDHHAASHLVAHCLREVESALRAALKAVLDLQSKKETKPKSKDAEEKPSTHEREVLAAAQFLGLAQSDRALEIWLSLTDRESEATLSRRAHRDTLRDPRPINDAYQQWWEDMQLFLDRVLDRFESQFVGLHPPIEAKLKSIARPTLDDAKWFLNHIPNNVRAQLQALECCKSVEWLIVLHEAGYFAHPQAEEPGEDPDTVRYPPWPAAPYLEELAKQNPSRVAAIVKVIAGQGNPYVQTQIARVAHVLPSALAATWSSAFIAASAGRYLDPLLADILAKLILHLARGGEIDAALDLTRFLFEPQPDRDIEARRKESGLALSPEPRVRFDLWHYEQNLRTIISELTRHGELATLETLASLLDQALTLRRRDDEAPGEDHSTVWRDTIRGDGHLSHGPLNGLISAVRNCALALLCDGRATIADVLATLRKYAWTSVRRIELHVLVTHPDFDRVAEALEEWVSVPYRDPEPEFFQLAEAQFTALPTKVQSELLAKIGAGPASTTIRDLLERLATNWAGFVGAPAQPVTDEDVARFIRDWQLRRLAALRAALPAELRQIYECLVSEFSRSGEPEPRRFVTRSVDPGDPEARKQLRELSAREILDIFAHAPMANVIDGFARADLLTVLAQLLADHPEQLVPETSRIITLPTDVSRSLFGAIGTARNHGRNIPWEHVIQLCQACVSKDPMEAARSAASESLDDNFRNIALLLREALADDAASPIPFGLREPLWKVIERLMVHPSPRSDPPPRDAYSAAINSVRGTAVEAAIYYAFWVWRGLIAAAGKHVSISLDKLPEVRALLERHLNPLNDPSPAVRSVFGVHLVHLRNLDASWIRANSVRVFPEDNERLLDAAWDGFVTGSTVPLDLLDDLRALYLRAIVKLTETMAEHSRDYQQSLGAHILLYYWHGVARLDDPLVVEFFLRAPADVRGLAIGAIGRMLYKEAKPAPDVLDRLSALWDWRLREVAKVASVDDRRVELDEFGCWFASKHFDDAWALRQLVATLRLAGEVEPDSLVAERMAELAPQSPDEALAFAEETVAGARHTWRLQAAEEHLRAIIDHARASGHADLIRRSDELVSRMIARGL